MGLYFRKSLSVGPFRLNASASGLGISVGVPGARVGVGPRGSYIQVGRGGVYYRQALSASPASRRRLPPTGMVAAGQPARATGALTPVPNLPPTTAGISAFRSLEGEGLDTFASASSSDILTELNRVEARWPLLPMVIAGGVAVLGLSIYTPVTFWAILVLGALVVAAVSAAARIDARQGQALLHYELDAGAQHAFESLRKQFAAFASCGLVRHNAAAADVYDRKRNAGASELLNTTDVRPIRGLPRRVRCNVDVPVLPAGRRTFYFFPDRVLIYEGSRVGAVTYDDLRAESGATRFIEERTVPPDAEVVGSTWKYVNKGGGPDRRFNNNRQLPIARYGTLALTTASGLRAHFLCSRPEAARQFAAGLAKASAGAPRLSDGID